MVERLEASLAAVRKLKGRLYELLQDTEQGILANALVQHELEQEGAQQQAVPAWRAGNMLHVLRQKQPVSLVPSFWGAGCAVHEPVRSSARLHALLMHQRIILTACCKRRCTCVWLLAPDHLVHSAVSSRPGPVCVAHTVPLQQQGSKATGLATHHRQPSNRPHAMALGVRAMSQGCCDCSIFIHHHSRGSEESLLHPTSPMCIHCDP